MHVVATASSLTIDLPVPQLPDVERIMKYDGAIASPAIAKPKSSMEGSSSNTDYRCRAFIPDGYHAMPL